LSFQFSEFSTIFYAFYKFLQTTNTIEDSFRTEVPGKLFRFTPRPLVHVKLPGKSWTLAIGSLGMVAGGAGIGRGKGGGWLGDHNASV
jgi:hypothetical protein